MTTPDQENELQALLRQHAGGIDIGIDRRDDGITGVLQHILVVERDQGLVLDDHDPVDPSFAPAEEHVGATPPV